MNLEDKKYSSIILVISIFFALYLAYLPIDMFIDRDNYLNYAAYSELIFANRIQNGLISFAFNEPFFLFIILILSNIFLPEYTIRIIIAFSTFSTFYLVLKNVPKKYLFLALLILLLPQVLKNNIIHLRQGLAISIFLWGWFANRKSVKLVMFLIAALTHASFLIILPGILIVFLIQKLNVSRSLKFLVYFTSGIGFGIFGLVIASSFGARQGEGYEGVENNVSGMGFLFWFCVLIIYIFQGKSFSKNNAFALYFIIFYLTTYFFIPVTARIFESMLIIVLLASIELKGSKKTYFYIIYIFYFLFTWSTRLSKPGFGWDIINYQ